MNKLIYYTKKYDFIVLSILFAILIFMFSNQPANESSVTSSTVANIIKTYYILGIPIRKFAHLSIFFCFTFCVGMAIVRNCRFDTISTYYIVTISICILYALLDEFHQSFIIGRCASLKDVLIDSSGGSIACCCVYIIVLIIEYYQNYKYDLNLNI